MCGPGIWWKETPDGILFLDGSSEKGFRDDGPMLQHFRSMLSTELELHLHQQWEACFSKSVHLPAKYLRYYGQHGNLEDISTVPSSASLLVNPTASPPVNPTTSLPENPVAFPLVNPTSSLSENPTAPLLVNPTASPPVDPIASLPVNPTASPPVDPIPSLLKDRTVAPSFPISLSFDSRACVKEPTASLPLGHLHTALGCTATSSHRVDEATKSATLPKTPYNYKTSLGKTLCSILQDSPALRKFDSLRFSIKNSSSSLDCNKHYAELSKA